MDLINKFIDKVSNLFSNDERAFEKWIESDNFIKLIADENMELAKAYFNTEINEHRIPTLEGLEHELNDLHNDIEQYVL